MENQNNHSSNGESITIDELARMVADGFGEQKKYIDQTFDKKFDEKFDEKFAPVRAKLSQMVTIDYLDKKMAEMRGDTIIRERKLEKRQDREIEIHLENKNLAKEQAKELNVLRIFPSAAQLLQE